MSKIYKKILGVSLVLGSLFSFCAIANAANEFETDNAIAVLKSEDEKKEDDDTAIETSSLVNDIAKKVTDNAAGALKEKIDDTKEQNEKIKDKISGLVEDMNKNIDEVKEKQEKAEEEKEEQTKLADELKDKEDELDKMKSNIELQKKLDETIEEAKKTSNENFENMSKELQNEITSANENKSSSSEKKD